MISYNIEEIISRHSEFIKTYFEKIIVRISVMMKSFMDRLTHMNSISDKIEFPKLLDFVFRCFEAIEKEEFVYDKESLNKIYEKRSDHPRYQNLIDSFYSDLRESINGHLENLNDIFNPNEKQFEDREYKIPEIIINIVTKLSNENDDDDSNVTSIDTNRRRSYHYELGKLAEKHELLDIMCKILLEDFSDNGLITEEINHMQMNRHSDIEYYCAYRLLSQEVEKYEEEYS